MYKKSGFILILSLLLSSCKLVNDESGVRPDDIINLVAYDRFAKYRGEQPRVLLGTIKKGEFSEITARPIIKSGYLYFKATFDLEGRYCAYKVSNREFEVFDFDTQQTLAMANISEEEKLKLSQFRGEGCYRFTWDHEHGHLLVHHWDSGYIKSVEIWQTEGLSLKYLGMVDFRREKAARVMYVGWDLERKMAIFSIIMKVRGIPSDIGVWRTQLVFEDAKVVGLQTEQLSYSVIKNYDKYPYEELHRNKDEIDHFKFLTREFRDEESLKVIHKIVSMGKFNPYYGSQHSDGDDVAMAISKSGQGKSRLSR